MERLNFEEYLHLFGEKIIAEYKNQFSQRVVLTEKFRGNTRCKYNLYIVKSNCRYHEIISGKKEINKFMLENKLVKIS